MSGQFKMKFFLILPLAALSACATVVNGSSQTVTVSTTPPGANCTLDRIGAHVAAISSTPGSVRLDKSKNELTVTCTKEGFRTAHLSYSPSFSGWTFGNLVAGGVVGVVVDAASGANYAYPKDIRIDMARDQPPALPPIAMQALPSAQSPYSAPASMHPVNASASGQTETHPAIYRGLEPRS